MRESKNKLSSGYFNMSLIFIREAHFIFLDRLFLYPLYFLHLCNQVLKRIIIIAFHLLFYQLKDQRTIILYQLMYVLNHIVVLVYYTNKSETFILGCIQSTVKIEKFVKNFSIK